VTSAVPGPTKACPYCGEQIQPTAKKCRYCGEYLDRALKAQAQAAPRVEAGVAMMVPVNRPGSAIAAGYLGLLALFPFIGFLAGIGAIWAGLVALKTLKQKPEMMGRGRAIFGLIAGGLGVLANGTCFISLIINLVVRGR
jgi:hypothetical protein